MNNVKTLMKATLIQTFGLNKFTKAGSMGEKAKYIVLGIVILWAILSTSFSMFLIYYQLSDYLMQINGLDLLLTMGYLSSSLVVLFMTIYMAPGYLYAFKDFDLLMSLPLKNQIILFSKVFYLYLSTLMVTIFMGLPIFLVYGIKSGGNFGFYILLLLMLLLIPLLPMSLGSILAIGIGSFSTRFKKSNVVILIGSFVLILAFIIGSTGINMVSKEQIKGIESTFEGVNHYFFPAKIFVSALSNNNILQMLLFVLLYVVLFGGFIIFFSKSFRTINAKMNETYQASNYKMTALKVSSPLKALVKKEIKYYFGTYIYVFNTGFGIVLMTLYALAVPIFGKDILKVFIQVPNIEGMLGPVMTIFLLFCISMTFITAPVISLEGKNLWILKSLPISSLDILKSKALLELTLLLPILLIDTTILSIGLHLKVIDFFWMIVLGILYTFLSTFSGLIINLLFPKMEWKTPVVVVKQSASVLLATLFGFLAITIPIVLYALVQPKSYSVFAGCTALCLVFLNALGWIWLKTKGVRIFNSL
ncbi:MAG: ABC transporter permease [Vallitaleaceae bacterium]|nr:ABC transporter permease [Vallitaleaceae bacterium]